MAIVKVTEITAASPKSFDEAVRDGIKRASKTLRDIKGAWINDQTVVVKDGKIKEYRVNMKLSFVLKD